MQRSDVYEAWLQNVPWQLFGTFSFAWHVSDAQAIRVFKEFIDRMERGLRCPLAYVRGDEKRFSSLSKTGAPRHYHLLLAAERELEATWVAEHWRALAGCRADGATADVAVYDPFRNALPYTLKSISSDQGNWDCRNLDLFLCTPAGPSMNRRQRRRLARHVQRREALSAAVTQSSRESPNGQHEMGSLEQNAAMDAAGWRSIVPEANTCLPLKGDFERMARRRFQDPTPKRRGKWWTLRFRRDEIVNGRLTRIRKEVRLALIEKVSERDARRLATEYLRPLNQGLESIGAAVNFQHYVEKSYIPLVMPQLAKSTQSRYQGVLDNYLIPTFGDLSLRDLTPMTLQAYFSKMANSPLAYESKDKIRDVLASVLTSARRYALLVTNPMESVKLPADRKGRRRNKPYLTPALFEQLIAKIPEPYATMVYVAIYTGLRVSELAGLRWEDVHKNGITIDERFCRGDWGAPKSDASNATIAVNSSVIERIHRLKLLTVEVRAGRAIRKYRVVKSDSPDALVFQSVREGKPIRDNNILSRFIKPAARSLGMLWVNWRALRTSHAVWLKLAGADPKDAQGQMRHSRISTTMDIYTQFVPESQVRVVERLSTLRVQ